MSNIIQFPKKPQLDDEARESMFMKRWQSKETDHMGDKMQRIKTSLEKINRMMTELKGKNDDK